MHRTIYGYKSVSLTSETIILVSLRPLTQVAFPKTWNYSKSWILFRVNHDCYWCERPPLAIKKAMPGQSDFYWRHVKEEKSMWRNIPIRSTFYDDGPTSCRFTAAVSFTAIALIYCGYLAEGASRTSFNIRALWEQWKTRNIQCRVSRLCIINIVLCQCAEFLLHLDWYCIPITYAAFILTYIVRAWNYSP